MVCGLNMDTIISVIEALCISYVILNFVGILMHLYRIRHLEEINNEIRYINEIAHRVDVEKHQDIYYWFDRDDGMFLGQGNTIEQIVDVLKSRFPTHIFFLPSNHKIHGPNWTFEPYDSPSNNS